MPICFLNFPIFWGILFHPLICNTGGVIAADPVNKSACRDN